MVQRMLTSVTASTPRRLTHHRRRRRSLFRHCLSPAITLPWAPPATASSVHGTRPICSRRPTRPKRARGNNNDFAVATNSRACQISGMTRCLAPCHIGKRRADQLDEPWLVRAPISYQPQRAPRMDRQTAGGTSDTIRASLPRVLLRMGATTSIQLEAAVTRQRWTRRWHLGPDAQLVACRRGDGGDRHDSGVGPPRRHQ